jgi:ubiquinone/menaquinone biosynthesis C-methylase UbiE
MSAWEDIYRSGNQLNKYPFSDVVSLIFQLKKQHPKLNVLELGCGAGNNIFFMAEQQVSAAGIDISPTAISFAKNRLADASLSADLKQGCFTSLPWQPNSFDFVLDRSALNCVPYDKIVKAIEECFRVLKPGGTLRSQIYSTDHPAYRDAHNKNRGFASGFISAGFEEIDGLFFADIKDIKMLFYQFDSLDITYSSSQNEQGYTIHAMWTVMAKKAD